MIIAFSGKLGSGKDTAGERMATMVDLPSRRVSFAAPLKESAAALLDIPTEEWEQYKNDPDVKIFLTDGYTDTPLHVIDPEEFGGAVGELQEPNIIREFTAREFLQRYGTESHRDIFGDDFWVEQASKAFTYSQGEFVYCTDARFVNEARAIKGLDGYIVRVLGPDEETGGHVSENGLPDEFITFEISNDVRDDDFAHLDTQLVSLALAVGLPLKGESVARSSYVGLGDRFLPAEEEPSERYDVLA